MTTNMHELNVAHNILDYALSEAARNGSKRVEEIDIEVGELTQIDPKILSDSLALFMTGTALEGCRARVEVADASFVCRKCSHHWSMSEVKKELESVSDELKVREPDSEELPLHFLPGLYSAFIHCPHCGSSDTSALSGEDIRIRRLVLE